VHRPNDTESITHTHTHCWTSSAHQETLCQPPRTEYRLFGTRNLVSVSQGISNSAYVWSCCSYTFDRGAGQPIIVSAHSFGSTVAFMTSSLTQVLLLAADNVAKSTLFTYTVLVVGTSTQVLSGNFRNILPLLHTFWPHRNCTFLLANLSQTIGSMSKQLQWYQTSQLSH